MPIFSLCEIDYEVRGRGNLSPLEERRLRPPLEWDGPLARLRARQLLRERGAGPRDAATVMTLAGCAPNPRPLPSERSTLAARRGVSIIQAGETTTESDPEIACARQAQRVAFRPWLRCF